LLLLFFLFLLPIDGLVGFGRSFSFFLFLSSCQSFRRQASRMVLNDRYFSVVLDVRIIFSVHPHTPLYHTILLAKSKNHHHKNKTILGDRFVGWFSFLLFLRFSISSHLTKWRTVNVSNERRQTESSSSSTK
jgi:hypothetical protein